MGVRREYMFQTRLEEAREMRTRGVYLNSRTTRQGLVRLASTFACFGYDKPSNRCLLSW